MGEIVIFFILLIVGYTVGSVAEARHFRTIKARERELAAFPILSTKTLPSSETIERAWLVDGSCVVSSDYFKRILAMLIGFVGGRITSYESLIDRARREAILRMQKEAVGADLVVNLRVVTSTIGSADRRRMMGGVEALAYGTAIKKATV